ncbi:sucrose-6-phosphate hydrolase [Staphylococcus canis]|uniref:Sucrose-6-phosphate hydrolase n=1 Tax=Staphylococcus canis TaxID=2724942 RepID=A0ABS0T7T9_9STAP|nr:sucrose-6-phosphate hydrolase [Staphylococcus canis]MBI5974816.1 sucrose-6-phosphate hydrolase [Staphylococcus canis]
MSQKYAKVTNNRYRLGYHIMPKSGWINDPNGFSYFDGYYHIFYQHYPFKPEWGPMHWGHARSKDLVNWETLPIALTPGGLEDKDGCFSGTAIEKDGLLYLFYTGHHYYGDNNPDHFWQNQNLAYSNDGIHFKKYSENAVISKPPEDNTHHFRDPKVWKYQDTYYMIIGSQNNRELGRIIMYKSKDLINWEYLGPVSESKDQSAEGYMWECPDLFDLNGHHVLLFSPQGIQTKEEKYLNLFQNGYFIGNLDYQNTVFTRGEFKELDHGHDFYAPQTMLSPDNRRILIGWMAMWESHMPEKKDGWSGALTLPRELILKNNHLYMKPVDELKKLRINTGIKYEVKNTQHYIISSDSKNLEINISIPYRNFTFAMKDSKDELISLNFNHDKNKFILYRNDLNSYRYSTIMNSNKLKLQIYVDTSSIEIFINDGESVFTERYYTEEIPEIFIKDKDVINSEIEVFELKNNVITFD